MFPRFVPTARRHALPLILGLLTALPVTAADVERATDAGRLLGERRDTGVQVYKAIPYALPPVGVRRWRPPEPAPDWNGVRDARDFAPQCVQPPYPAASVFARPSIPESEDCLYLNVWTSKDAGADAPVMVWIHGGGLTRGTGATHAYDGGNLAQKGVVVVTINYRLGPFGYLAHPALSAENPRGVSGNYGYLDQVAALEWVREHIDAFGGDPDRVTVFGESAGSRSVNALMVMPAAKGLFAGAIGQSGGGFAPTQALDLPVYSLRPAHAWGEELEAALAVDGLAAMREVPAHRVLAKALEIGLPMTTVVDGAVIPDQPATLFAAGKQHPVPVIVGFNKDEGTSLTAPTSRPRSAERFEAGVRERFGDAADRFLEVYPSNTAEASWLDAFRDENFGWEMVRWANATAPTEADAWMYFFSFHPSGPYRTALRAYHAGEIRYVFDNDEQIAEATEEDAAVADAMSSAWVSFAEDGDPNTEGLPPWQPWNPEQRNYMDFGAVPEPRTGLIEDASTFFDSVDPGALLRD